MWPYLEIMSLQIWSSQREGISMGLKNMTGVLMKRKQDVWAQIQTCTEVCYINSHKENAMSTWRQKSGWWSSNQGVQTIAREAPKTRREAWGRFSNMAPERNQPYHLHLGLLASKTARQSNASFWAPWFVVLCYGNPNESVQEHSVKL